MSERPPGRYGFDAPRLIAVPVLLMIAGLVQAVFSRSPWPLIGVALIGACCGLGFYASRRGKFVVWARLFDGLGLRGDEEVLDLGCGRGALLISAALRVPKGRAVGVDLWRTGDQSGNGPEATLRNAAAAGVSEVVSVETADITALPFPDESFDLVVSNIVVHNLMAPGDRDRAVAEAVRVLRPGGRLLLADLGHTRQYESRLRGLGLPAVSRRSLGWRQWWSGPWLPTHLVSARKP
ncbi:type 11 methyltransferase [Paractinoplanes abujensis]|uniref:SAM-dependent methyltransferase n=1 Tax=Paractinoplanes abujensis TaxID=882441 RepID=A0A7W7CMS1_9ACTN|nr:class I SAM-dependent methyltransferase [Actinoplanes abujensis]MBB4691412.1 SAM-dependent methyltransferase [Actinoplanes abujensis]GID17175.1 type 11 methyltransferase [Actinoplanes abujensis]